MLTSEQHLQLLGTVLLYNTENWRSNPDSAVLFGRHFIDFCNHFLKMYFLISIWFEDAELCYISIPEWNRFMVTKSGVIDSVTLVYALTCLHSRDAIYMIPNMCLSSTFLSENHFT